MWVKNKSGYWKLDDSSLVVARPLNDLEQEKQENHIAAIPVTDSTDLTKDSNNGTLVEVFDVISLNKKTDDEMYVNGLKYVWVEKSNWIWIDLNWVEENYLKDEDDDYEYPEREYPEKEHYLQHLKNRHLKPENEDGDK